MKSTMRRVGLMILLSKHYLSFLGGVNNGILSSADPLVEAFGLLLFDLMAAKEVLR